MFSKDDVDGLVAVGLAVSSGQDVTVGDDGTSAEDEAGATSVVKSSNQGVLIDLSVTSTNDPSLKIKYLFYKIFLQLIGTH